MKKETNKKILVTGFEPFGGESFNPSSWILDFIKQDPVLKSCCQTRLLPVDFKEAHHPVIEALNDPTIVAWIGFGQAGGRTKLSLERVALNWKESKYPDNTGFQPHPEPLDPAAERAYFSTGPLVEMQTILNLNELPVEISFSAGAYVCNSLYFHVLREMPKDKWGLFVHVPYGKSQTLNDPSRPYLEEEKIALGAKLIILEALKISV